MNDYHLSDALEEIESIAYSLGQTHESAATDELRGQQRARILDIRAAIFEALSSLDDERQKSAGITCPIVDESAINPVVVVEALHSVRAAEHSDDWL